jgi:hypothetical protein
MGMFETLTHCPSPERRTSQRDAWWPSWKSCAKAFEFSRASRRTRSWPRFTRSAHARDKVGSNGETGFGGTNAKMNEVIGKVEDTNRLQIHAKFV